eukprot:scaffold28009_cov55-Phaeocystis_antarctica.AAC.7
MRGGLGEGRGEGGSSGRSAAALHAPCDAVPVVVSPRVVNASAKARLDGARSRNCRWQLESGAGKTVAQPLAQFHSPWVVTSSCVGWSSSSNVLQGPVRVKMSNQTTSPLAAAWSALCSCLSSSGKGRAGERSEGAEGAKSAKGAKSEPPPPPKEQEELEQQLQVAARAASAPPLLDRAACGGLGGLGAVVLVARPRWAPLTPPPQHPAGAAAAGGPYGPPYHLTLR